MNTPDLTTILAMGPYPPRWTIPMAKILSILAVVLAAFVVWLGVRIFNRRERWAKRTAVGLALGLPVLYVLSIGPAIWLSARDISLGLSFDGRRFTDSFYQPVLWSMVEGPSFFGTAISWWGSLGVPAEEWVYLTVDTGEATVVFEFSNSPDTTEPPD